MCRINVNIEAQRYPASFTLGLKQFASLMRLMAVMKVLEGLFKPDAISRPRTNGDDVDEEVASGGDGVVGRVDLEHFGVWLLVSGF